MTIREQLELRELEYLSSYAALSKDSKGRKRKRNRVISDRLFKEIVTGFFIVKLSEG